MKPIILSLLLLLSFSAFTQNKEPYSWYKCFTGKIDKYLITMHLYKSGNEYSGYYYYNSSEEPIYISGRKATMLKLTFTKEGDQEEAFEGTLNDSSFSGTWSYKNKILPFRLTEQKGKTVPAFSFIVVSGTQKIPKTEDNPDRDELSYYAAAVWPVSSTNTALGDSLKKLIAGCVEDKNYKDDIGKIFLQQKNDWFKEEKKSKERPEMFETNDRIYILFSNNKIISLVHYDYGDYGGVHGEHGTGYHCIQTANGKPIDITDVFDTTSVKDKLSVLLEKKIRKKYELSDKKPLNEQLLVDKIPLTNNLLITSKCIGFSYMPYEIGSYAMGDIFVSFTYAELESLLRPSFKALVQ